MWQTIATAVNYNYRWKNRNKRQAKAKKMLTRINSCDNIQSKQRNGVINYA